MGLRAQAPRARDALIVLAVALVARLGTLLWAATRFPPIEDGRYYHVLATRLADGLGYTWLWPDGVVTHAAHYPVGYPALIAVLYAVFTPAPELAMLLNALLGSVAAALAYDIAAQTASRAGCLLAGLLVALHPALVFYTPALMTEGVIAALLVIALWLALRGAERGHGYLVALGVLLGIATLIRPQTLLLAPCFGLVALRPPASWKRRSVTALLTTALALAVVAPWTARNCAKMDRCVVVSANGGWNLLIGATPEARGTFAPVADEIVPTECRTVFGEAQKDVCFGRAALGRIRDAPLGWLARIPAKLSHTFDPGGAAAWYLATSNPAAFGERARLTLAAAETLWQRAVLLLALIALALAPGPRLRGRQVLAALAGLGVLTPSAWLGYLGLVAVGALLGPALLAHLPALGAVSVVATTALAHALFFGAGRYSLVCFAAVAVLSGSVWRRPDRF